jgi:hypothetical protein
MDIRVLNSRIKKNVFLLSLTNFFLPILNTDFGRVLGSPAILLSGSRGDILRKIISKPSFCYVIWSNSARSIAHAKSMAHFGFATKKGKLRIKLQY